MEPWFNIIMSWATPAFIVWGNIEVVQMSGCRNFILNIQIKKPNPQRHFFFGIIKLWHFHTSYSPNPVLVIELDCWESKFDIKCASVILWNKEVPIESCILKAQNKNNIAGKQLWPVNDMASQEQLPWQNFIALLRHKNKCCKCFHH